MSEVVDYLSRQVGDGIKCIPDLVRPHEVSVTNNVWAYSDFPYFGHRLYELRE